MNLDQIRQKYPQYKNVPDAELARAMHQKYYSNVPFEEFAGKIGYKPETGEKKWYDPSGLARTALGQGLMMGWGDEAEAAFRSKVMGQGNYETNLNKIRADVEKYKKDNPNVALGAEIAGGALPVVATMGAGAGLNLAARGAGTAASKLAAKGAGTIGRNAAIGAGAGAISGAGGAEGDLGDRALGAGFGATIGGVGGAVIPKAVSLGGNALRQTKRFLTPSSSATIGAEEKIARALAENDMDPSKIRAIMQRDRELGVPTRLLDAGQNMTDLATGVASLPGKGRRTVIEAMEPRIESARGRVAARAHQDIGGNQNFVQKEEELIKNLRENAKGLYEQAYAHGIVPDDSIRRYLGDRNFQNAFAHAKRIADDEASLARLRGEDPSKYLVKDIFRQDPKTNEWVQTGVMPDVRTLDYMKRGLDDVIANEWKNGSPSRAVALKDTKNMFLKDLDEAVPAYKEARKTYAGDAEMRDALEFGRDKLFKNQLSPDALKKELAAMSPAERQMVKVGAAEDLNNYLGNQARKTNAAQNIFGSGHDQAKIEQLFGDNKAFTDFADAMRRESQLFEHSGQVYKGSQTAPRMSLKEDVAGGDSALGDTFGTIADIANFNIPGVAGKVDRVAGKWDYPQRRTEELAGMLTTPSSDEAAVNALTARLEKRGEKLAGRDRFYGGLENAANLAQGSAATKSSPYGYLSEEDQNSGALP